MIFPFPDSILQSQIKLAEERFGLLIADSGRFTSIVAAGLAYQGSSHLSEKLALAGQGMMSIELFQAMMSGENGYKLEGLSLIWERLVSSGLLVRIFIHLPGVFADHMVDQQKLASHLRDDIFANLFRPVSFLGKRYAGSVLAIDVEKSGESYRGSGFLLQVDDRNLLVTCRHNVDPEEGIEVTSIATASGWPVDIAAFAFHERFDLAVADLNAPVPGSHFRPGPRPKVFDDAFTLGYPRVPQAESGILGHRGEVNGAAELYALRCPILLISNLVSPGSSGCPVLANDGHCLGMTIQWLEAEYGDGRARFSAAIPADEIVAFAQSR